MNKEPLDKMLLRLFCHEVERQCTFGLMASDDLRAAIQGPVDRIWFSIQNLLVAAGNVSKLLWPPRPRIPNRGEELRKVLGVPDDSPLAPRTFRNYFEHFDERLEEWATSSDRKNFVDSNVGSPGMIARVDSGDFLRNFDTTTFAVTFRGDTYPLQPNIDSMIELHRKARAKVAELSKK
jgi:hypothetical protein